jgi:5-methylcytosine-specific restriction endonuclease McrA
MLRQEGRCADCGTQLIIGFFVFDHRPPLALREPHEDVNDPDRLAAICWRCNEQKTPTDLKEIARARRLERDHVDFRARQREKLPGRRLPSPRQWWELDRGS